MQEILAEIQRVIMWALRSRKVWVAFLSLITVILGTYLKVDQVVLNSVTALGMALIGSIAWEDSKRPKG